MADFAEAKLRIDLDDRSQSLLNRPIDGIKIDDTIPFVIFEIAQNGVDTWLHYQRGLLETSGSLENRS